MPTAVRRTATLAVACCLGLSLGAAADQPPTTRPADAPKMMPAMSMGGGANAEPRNPVTISGEGKAEATLTMDVRKFDFAGTKAANRMYMPESTPLSPQRPEGIRNEPAYAGAPLYATLTLGSGSPNRYVVAIDQPPAQDAAVYLDLNGDGDLTNDDTGPWEQKREGDDGAAPSYQGTYVFQANWKNADGSETSAPYALNLYWQAGRTQLGFYTASARVGKIDIDGKQYDVMIVENNADGLFNKLYDPTKPIVVGERMTKPVWLFLDGNQYDIRGTFPFGGMNYLATVSDDGARLSLAPTMKVVMPPRPAPAEKVTALQAGVEAPDFEALVWKPGQQQLDTSSRLKLSDYRGKKIVVLDMWATWCGPCMKGIPHLSKVAEAVKDQDVEVIALNTSDDEEPFVRFATGKGQEYKFTLARDPAGRDKNGNTIARKLYGVTGIPATFVIDKSGKIVGTVSGYSEGDTRLEQILMGLGVKVD